MVDRSERLLILIVFISSACIMALELVASRIVAPYIGNSLYTWTGVIGVVLAGISLGNYLGGRLADHFSAIPCIARVPDLRRRSRLQRDKSPARAFDGACAFDGARLLGGVLALGGLSSLCILAVDVLERLTQLQALTPANLPLVIAMVAMAVVLFFVPCTVLGTISPVVAKLAVRDLDKTGSTVGRIYAAGSVGSIVGTFATGFLLISWFGTHAVVWGVALVLLALGLLFLLEGQPARLRWSWAALAVLALAGGSVLAFRRGWLEGPCTRETNYFCIQVREEKHGGERVQVLYLDRLLHSYSSLDDPTRLVYEYEKLYADATAYQALRVRQGRGEKGKATKGCTEKGGHLRALFIGGGGYTFPRYMEAVYPDSEIDVIEIDPGVTEVAYDMLGLRRDTRVVTYNEDARMFLARKPDKAYDLVMGDAFNDFSVPYHLTTKEFNERVRAWLAGGGLYVVNIIDGPWGSFLRAYTHTLRQTFRHVYLAFTVSSWRQSSRSTLVLIASDVPLDMASLEATAPLLASQLLSQDEVDALLAEGRTVTLTDHYAPVDQMLVPVFLDLAPDDGA